MTIPAIRRLTARAVSALAVGALVLGLSSCGESEVTRPRLEAALPQTFSNLYVQQAAILGHEGITVRSLDARATCDKGGPKVEDTGPGADWICLMSWKDPAVPLPDGTGKFELQVRSNGCFTAGAPSKLIGTVMIPDRRGNDVLNPVFEFDACFDPAS